eukprot:scaffold295590_cov32-Tisochrysis_lutea.AAC.5
MNGQKKDRRCPVETECRRASVEGAKVADCTDAGAQQGCCLSQRAERRGPRPQSEEVRGRELGEIGGRE